MEKVRCQRIGCDAMFSEDNNPNGMKEWSCCKKRSHDFSLFLEIPGCKTGKNTTEKPVLAAALLIRLVSVPTPATTNSSSKYTCPRCREGFFCSDHGSHGRELNQKATKAEAIKCKSSVQEAKPPQPKKILNISQPQTCKNKGCGKSFKEIEKTAVKTPAMLIAPSRNIWPFFRYKSKTKPHVVQWDYVRMLMLCIFCDCYFLDVSFSNSSDL